MIIEREYELTKRVEKLEKELSKLYDLSAVYSHNRTVFMMQFIETNELEYAVKAKVSTDFLEVTNRHIEKTKTELRSTRDELNKARSARRTLELDYFYGVGNIDIRERIDKHGYLNGFKI